MNTDIKAKGGKILSTVWDYARILILNTWRRVIILGRYCLICVKQQQLRRQWTWIGYQVMEALARGEVNPMLEEPVKDRIDKAKALQEVKDRHYQAVAAWRDKIRASRAGESPSPPPETAS